jgi:hypothetical protein
VFQVLVEKVEVEPVFQVQVEKVEVEKVEVEKVEVEKVFQVLVEELQEHLHIHRIMNRNWELHNIERYHKNSLRNLHRHNFGNTTLHQLSYHKVSVRFRHRIHNR